MTDTRENRWPGSAKRPEAQKICKIGQQAAIPRSATSDLVLNTVFLSRQKTLMPWDVVRFLQSGPVRRIILREPDFSRVHYGLGLGD